eukprot:TRINITY_DN2872_c0_g1_i12.p1 TRINITY_DN2872_c0_g1~~TRINITY_DN2872_c0_g1_i12.p1  ORF type:complete len:467 (-),score=89.61 TRINITY_DN2872_c0_g1_i12:546-1946(-)
MIRRPPRSTLSSSSAASDVYKRQVSTQSTGEQLIALMDGTGDTTGAVVTETNSTQQSRTNLSKTPAYDILMHVTNDDTPAELPFSSGNPSVEVIQGQLRLFRDKHTTIVSEGEVGPSDMVCVLAVPAYLSTVDLVAHTCSGTQAKIENIRLLRDALVPDRRIALVKTASKADARLFLNDKNGSKYTSMSAGEHDLCRVVFVQEASIYSTGSEETTADMLPTVPDNKLELPTCIVCLERLDYSVTGRTELTTLCNHTFHRDCLELSMNQAGWSCPVCRYCTEGGPADSSCEECGSSTSLWICLICGYMGCGRYDKAHARKHFEETKHAYALDPESQRVWDYAGDGYVHRLIQNMVDGKLVELPDPCQAHGSDSRVDGEPSGIDKSMLEDVMCHYEQELMRHLETQRRYFEEELRKAAGVSVDAEHSMKASDLKLQQLKSKYSELEKEVEFLQQVRRVGFHLVFFCLS